MRYSENTCVGVQAAGNDMSCNITHICIHTQTLQLQHRDTIFNLWYEIEKFLCDNKKEYPLFKPKNCIRYNCKDCFDSDINFFEYLLHGRHRHRVRVKKGVVFYGRSPHFGRFRH